MGKFKGRNAVACTACHSQKVKCDGALPCGRCVLRERECVYPEKKPNYVTVSESYMRELERAAGASRDQASSSSSAYPAASGSAYPSSSAQGPGASWGTSGLSTRAAVSDDFSTEHFVHELREMSMTANPGVSREQSGYTYVVLRSDIVEPQMVIKIPSEPLATRLLDTFEEIFCDYHWFLRRDFRNRISLLFLEPETQSKDRNWLARVSLVFALATTFMYGSNRPDEPGHSGQSLPRETSTTDAPVPPGSDMFEQAVQLLKTSPEEPTTGDVEALNLMAFYSYSLNRRRTAYTHANHSLALARLLHLDRRPSSPGMVDSVAAEHRKRLWWTSFCMERMVSAELGLLPAANLPAVEAPSAESISLEDMDQFFDAALLTLQTQMCAIKSQISESVSRLRRVSDMETIIRELGPCLDTLHSWREHVPPSMAFDFSEGVPSSLKDHPSSRGIASLYLRYHQCFTILLRPVCSKELPAVLQSGGYPSHHTSGGLSVHQGIQNLKQEGIQAARNNCKILLDLFNRGKHAKFGYWDSVHAFSSLSIIAISRATNLDMRGQESSDDAYLYSQCRHMLKEMARAGNPAAQDHDALLADVEAIVAGGSVGQSMLQEGVDDTGMAFDPDLRMELDHQLWSDADWASFLNTYSRWA